MDQITPITAGAAALPSRTVPPVQRLQRVSREQDRPSRKRQDSPDRETPPERGEDDGEQDGRPRLDVRV
jgi:hypothetical protein